MKWRIRADKKVIAATVASFINSPECSYESLSACEERAWLRSYYWLDANGMALYLLNHLETMGIESALPASTLARFRQNLIDNNVQSSVMYEEFISINLAFQSAGVCYSNLKGFTFSPECCPDPALRSQLDLDFLVDGNQLDICREILSQRGYLLVAVTNKTWEFKAGASNLADIRDLYKPKPQRSLELHFTCSKDMPYKPDRDKRLDRLTSRLWNGHEFPILSPSDQFIGQALHLFGHICSPFTRVSWLLEYKRHLVARYNDQPFWEAIRRQAQAYEHTDIAIGLSTLVSSQLLGAEAPNQLNKWTLDTLPPSIKEWAELYGRRSLFADFPGTKLYLILKDQIPSGDTARQKENRGRLLPLHRAPKVTFTQPEDDLRTQLRSAIQQIRFIFFRFRFHFIEGLLYLVENARWKQHLNKIERAKAHNAVDQPSLTKANV